ncbi:MAG: tRNA (N(6)-L-threonylcarbamoyladenosine(37)-C(2))-methylthiotransferase MtaB [Treponema sp.]|nr:tRNA (N(6)-L-threonylcarbamoyladenosine(37)-C(2))-methylthiotransferase MtaB [Treponema sp.]
MFPVALHTLGCKLNQLESEAFADSFKKAGFPLIPPGEEMQGQGPCPGPRPGIIIINTCTVTSKADQKCRRLIRKLLRENPDSCVIVVGCYAQLDSEQIAALEEESGAMPGADGFRRLFVLGGNSVDGAGPAKSPLLELPEILRQAGGGKPSDIVASWIEESAGRDPFGFKPEDFAFHSRGYLKIQDGCDNSCTYCRVRLARGRSVSLPKEDALAQVRSFEKKGCAELMITGVNITQYDYSGCNLAGLLEYLLEGTSTIALRLASLEPERINERLASVLAHPRIRPHFHLSVQSGSDTVLRAMGRAYTSQAVMDGAALLRSAKDNPFLACDIIAGFAGETEAEFERTFALCEQINFAWIHAFPYSRRPGTAAFSLGNPVCERDATRRVEALTALAWQGRTSYAKSWLNRELSAIVEKSGSPAGQCRAVSENYLKLIVNCPDAVPLPAAAIRCTPVSLCEGADAVCRLNLR